MGSSSSSRIHHRRRAPHEYNLEYAETTHKFWQSDPKLKHFRFKPLVLPGDAHVHVRDRDHLRRTEPEQKSVVQQPGRFNLTQIPIEDSTVSALRQARAHFHHVQSRPKSGAL